MKYISVSLCVGNIFRVSFSFLFPFIILHLSFTANKKMKLNIILISDIFLFAVAEGKIQKNYEPPASTNISNSWRAGNPSD